MLEKSVIGFKAGVSTFLQATYKEKGLNSYHRYVGGDAWVPTVPEEVGRPGDILDIGIDLLTLKRFLTNYPALMLSNDIFHPWMADEATLSVKTQGDRVYVQLEQSEDVEGVSQCSLELRPLGDLVFQTGSTLANFEARDAFSEVKKVRLYHNGCSKAWLGTMIGGDFFRVFHVTYDGVRLRLAYRYAKGRGTTVFYLARPLSPYCLGDLTEYEPPYPLKGLSGLFIITGITAKRRLEKAILDLGGNYEVGRLGAEIAYAIISEKFRCDDLVVAEPAKGGKDLYSRDRRVAVQSRILRQYATEWSIKRELEQMTRKLRVDFGHTPEAQVGYAVLSYLRRGRISSLIAEVKPKAQ